MKKISLRLICLLIILTGGGSRISGIVTLNAQETTQIPPAPAPGLPASQVTNYYSTKYGTDTPLNYKRGTTDITPDYVLDTDNNQLVGFTNPLIGQLYSIEYADSEQNDALNLNGANQLHMEIYASEATLIVLEAHMYANKITGVNALKVSLGNITLTKGWNPIDKDITRLVDNGGYICAIKIVSTKGGIPLYLDHVYFYGSFPAAPIPTPNPDDITNVYSTKYNETPNVSGFDFISTGGSTTVATQIEDSKNNEIWKLSTFDTQTIEYQNTNNILDISGRTTLHMEAYAEKAISLKVKAILNGGITHTFDDVFTLTADEWNSIDVNLLDFLNQTNGNISAIQLIDEGSESSTIYLDHLYFYTRIPTAPLPIPAATDIANFYSSKYGTDNIINLSGEGATKAVHDYDQGGGKIIKITDLGLLELQYQGNNEVFGLDANNQIHLELYPLDEVSLSVGVILNANKIGNPSKIEYYYDLPTALVANEWNSVDMNILDFAAQTEYNVSTIVLKNKGGNATTVYADHVYFYYKSIPTYLPYLPESRSEGYVKSIYSYAYPSALGEGLPQFETGGSTTVSEISVPVKGVPENSKSNKIWSIESLEQLSISLGNGLNVSDMEYLNLDIFAGDASSSSIKIFLKSADNKEYAYTQPLVYNKWNHITIPLTEYSANGVNLSTIKYIGLSDGSQKDFFVSNVYFSKNQTPPTPEPIAEVNRKLGGGVNMGNTFEDVFRGATGNNWDLDLLEDLIDSIAGLGFKNMRLPVKWDQSFRTNENAPYTINPVFLKDSVQRTVDYALGKGLKVILNIHHYDDFYKNPISFHKERFEAMWTQISTYFHNYSHDLLLEVLNEPNGNMTLAIWNQYLADAVSIIRENNSSRPIVVGTADWGGLPPLEQLRLPEDDNIIATVHLYNPGYIVNQGWNSVGNEDIEWWDTEQERQAVLSQFKVVDDFHRRYPNVPLHIGEFGIYNKADTDSRALWTAYVRNLFQQRGYSYSYWEFRAGFGIYNVNTKEYNEPIRDALLTTEVPERPAEHTFNSKEVIYNMQTDGTSSWSNWGGTTGNTPFKLVRTITQGGNNPSSIGSSNSFQLSQNANKTYRISFKTKASVEGFTYKIGVSEVNRNLATIMFTPGKEEEKEVSFTFALLKTSNLTDVTFSFGAITGDTKVTVEIWDFILEEVEKVQEAAPAPLSEAANVDNIFSSAFSGSKTLTFSKPTFKNDITDTNGGTIIQLVDFDNQTITFNPASISLDPGNTILHMSVYAGSAMDLQVDVTGSGGTKSETFKLPSHGWKTVRIPLTGYTDITSIKLSGGVGIMNGRTGTGRKLYIDHIYFADKETVLEEKQIEEEYGQLTLTADEDTGISHAWYEWDGSQFVPLSDTGNSYSFTFDETSALKYQVRYETATERVETTFNLRSVHTDSQNQTAMMGTEVTLLANENNSIQYNWEYSGSGLYFSEIENQTTNTYTINSAQISDAGIYRVSWDTDTESWTKLIILKVIELVEEERNADYEEGEITLTASEDTSVSYEWYVWSDSEGGSFVKLDKQNANTYSFTFTEASARKYQVRYETESQRVVVTFNVRLMHSSTQDLVVEEGDEAILQVTLVGGMEYKWEFAQNGEDFVLIGGETTNTHTINPAGLTDAGVYRVTWSIDTDVWSELITLSVNPAPIEEPLLVWTGAIDNDWNKSGNWTPQGVPGSSTIVYIPGKLTNYPVLSGNKVNNVCKEIYFMYGAELGRQDLLTYEKASVQFNFGLQGSTPEVSDDIEDHLAYSAKRSDVLGRDRWHMLSVPLKGMTMGDFTVGAYPVTYMRHFAATESENESYAQGAWVDNIASLNEELSAGEGFVFWLPAYKDEKQYMESLVVGETEFGLKALNGILEFPFYDKESMSAAHRSHEYNAETGKSRFYYMNKDLNLIKTKYDEVARSSDNYTFVNNDGNFNYSKNIGATDPRFLFIGNPYMYTIDFDKFYDQNQSVIKDHYYIWNQSTYDTYTTGVTSDNYLKPTQGFIVELAEDVQGAVSLKFPIADIMMPESASRKVAPLAKQRNILTITAQNPLGEISTWVTTLDNETAVLENHDARKLLSGIQQTPEIYTIKNTGNKKRGLAVQAIEPEVKIIPLAIASTYKGTMSLSFAGMSQYNANIFLVDTEKNVELELSDKELVEYEFVHTPTIQSGKPSANENRFYIHIVPKAGTGIDYIDYSYFVYDTEQEIRMMTDKNNPIQEVYIYDVQGRLLYGNRTVNDYSYAVKKKHQYPATVIVKLVCEKEAKSIKLIIQ